MYSKYLNYRFDYNALFMRAYCTKITMKSLSLSIFFHNICHEFQNSESLYPSEPT